MPLTPERARYLHDKGYLTTMTGRNIRPKADKPLPIVDFKKEIDALGIEDCPDCDGGSIDVDCDACNGRGCDDEGNPCTRCSGMGVLGKNCPNCDGTGEVITTDDGDDDVD